MTEPRTEAMTEAPKFPGTYAGRRLLAELMENPLNGGAYAYEVVTRRLPVIEDEAHAVALEEVQSLIWEHGMFIDWDTQTVTCGCGGFAGTMPFMQHIQAAIASLRVPS